MVSTLAEKVKGYFHRPVVELANDVVRDMPGQTQVIHREIPDHFVSFLRYDLEPVLGVSHWKSEGSGKMELVDACSARDWDGKDYLRIIPRVVLVEDPRLLKGPL